MLRTLCGLALIWAAPAAARSREGDRAALLAIEQQWLAGAGDAETLSRILADDFVHPVPTGDMLSKAQHIRWSSAHPPPRDGFTALMNRLAQAWNQGDARQAADCFTEDARYSAPPDPRIRRGRDELFRFFGGEGGRPGPMHMAWHHLVFDEAQQLGAGEYTFDYQMRTHGMVLVRIVGGRIAGWREWEHPSALSFEALTKGNAF